VLHLLHQTATVNWPGFQADRQWWMAIAVRAITVGFILSIHDLSFIPICCTPQKYVWWITSTISVAANQNLHTWIDCPDNDYTTWELWTYLTDDCEACTPVLVQSPGYHCQDRGRWLCSKSGIRVNSSLRVLSHCSSRASNLSQSLMRSFTKENSVSDDSLNTDM